LSESEFSELKNLLNGALGQIKALAYVTFFRGISALRVAQAKLEAEH